jgi:hypothetical protein
MTSQPATCEALWTAADVAGFLRVSRSWVYLHAEAGDFPCLRFAGVVRFDPAAIRAYARGDAVRASSVLAFPQQRAR